MKYSTGQPAQPMTAEAIEAQRGDSLKGYQDKVRDLKKEIKDLESNLATTKSAHDGEIRTLTKEIEDAKISYTADLREHEGEVETLNVQTHAITIELEKVTAEFRAVDKKVDDKRRELYSLDGGLRVCRSEHKAVALATDEANHKLGLAKDQIADLTIQEANLQKSIDSKLDWVKSIGSGIDERKVKLETQKEKIKEAAQMFDIAAARNRATIEKLKISTEERKELEIKQQEVRDKISSFKGREDRNREEDNRLKTLSNAINKQQSDFRRREGLIKIAEKAIAEGKQI